MRRSDSPRFVDADARRGLVTNVGPQRRRRDDGLTAVGAALEGDLPGGNGPGHTALVGGRILADVLDRDEAVRADVDEGLVDERDLGARARGGADKIVLVQAIRNRARLPVEGAESLLRHGPFDPRKVSRRWPGCADGLWRRGRLDAEHEPQNPGHYGYCRADGQVRVACRGASPLLFGPRGVEIRHRSAKNSVDPKGLEEEHCTCRRSSIKTALDSPPGG